MKFDLEIKSCGDCPFKTEYHGEPDYWLCDMFGIEITDMTIIHPDCQLEKVICKKGEIK